MGEYGFKDLPAFEKYLEGLEWTDDIPVYTFILRLQDTLERIEKQLSNILSTPSPSVLIKSMFERLDSLKDIINSNCPKDGRYGNLSCAIFENHFDPNISLNNFFKEKSPETGKNREELRELMIYGGDEKPRCDDNYQIRNKIIVYLKTYHSVEYEIFKDKEPYPEGMNYIDSSFEPYDLRTDISWRFFEVSIDIVEEQLKEIQKDLNRKLGLESIVCNLSKKRLTLFMKVLYYSDLIDSSSTSLAAFQRTMQSVFEAKGGNELNLQTIKKNMKPSESISQDDHDKLIDTVDSIESFIKGNITPK